MAKNDLTARMVSGLLRIETSLHDRVRRWVSVGIGIIVVVGLHAVLDDPRVAWLVALPVVLSGLSGGGRFGLATGGVAAAGHLGVDVALGLDAGELLGILGRTVTLPLLGVLGSVVSRIEEQRDLAVLRSVTEDAITGLLNVRAFYDALADLRREGTSYAILLADIAGMRKLNETYGHPTGTEALRTLGHVLRRNVKKRDLVARLGSDEIAIALVGADQQGAVVAAERLSARLAEESLALPDGQQFQVHAYYGVAAFPQDADNEVALLRQADHAISDAKERGAGQIGRADDAPGPQRTTSNGDGDDDEG